MSHAPTHPVEIMPVRFCLLSVATQTPVLAGVCGTDPFRVMKLFLRDVDAAGFSGVQNFPTVGLIDGSFRQGLEETGMEAEKVSGTFVFLPA